MLGRPPLSILLLTLALLSVGLAGCIGGGDEGSDEPLRKQRADVSTSLGGVEGVVTDTAVQPIAGANVTLVELDEVTRTEADGSYAFSLVQPGTYTVAVNGPGIVSTQEQVIVTAGQVAMVDFIVAHLVSEQPFTQAIEFAAFFECGVGVGHSVDNPGAPLWPRGVTWATCATINEPVPGAPANATNDRFSQNIRFEPPIETMVWEAQWDASGNAMAGNLWFNADIEGHAGIGETNATVFRDTSAASPFWAAVHRVEFDAIAEHFRTSCEDGDDTFCGYNFDDQGWPITVRTFTATDCLPTPASACAPLQLKVDHVFNLFYHAQAPEGFNVFGGGL